MNNLTNVFKENAKLYPYTYWQYVSTSNGEMILFPGTKKIYNPNITNTYDPRYRPWLI